MSELSCKHCGGDVEKGNKTCPNCGIPLPPNLGKYPRLRFVIFFIGVVIFCAVMIYWLPRNWI